MQGARSDLERMRSRNIFWPGALLALGCGVTGLSSPGSRANTPTSALSEEPATSAPTSCLDTQLTPYIQSIGASRPDSSRLTGVVMVSRGGKSLYFGGFGFANVPLKLPHDANTSFQIGSITKGFTAVAILQLVEAGKLKLNDPLSRHFPSYPKHGATITIHQLLTHTSGIPNYTGIQSLIKHQSEFITPQKLMESFWQEALEFEPGSEFRYSNSGYVVLGRIIEKASGQEYSSYLQKHLFKPAGMTRTVVGDWQAKNRARGYEATSTGEWAKAAPIDMSFPYSAGAISSTANDLVQWDQALRGTLLLSAESKKKLYTPEKQKYAYGWQVEERQGVQVIQHGGGINGFRSSLVRVPAQQLVVTVLSNGEGGAFQLAANAALRCALEKKLTPLEPPEPIVELSQSQQMRTVGTYSLTPDSRGLLQDKKVPTKVIESIAQVTLRLEDGALYFKPLGQKEHRLLSTSPSSFEIPAARAHLDLFLPEGTEERATLVQLKQNGLVVRYARAEAK